MTAPAPPPGPTVWCVQHRTGWCATKSGRPFEETDNQVQTFCKHVIILPTGSAERQPTCPECRELLGRKVAGTLNRDQK